jgi:hypothetical protein
MVADMNCLTVEECMCHKWPRICFISRNQNSSLSPFMSFQRISNNCNTTGVTTGAGSVNPSGAREFAPVILLVLVGFVSFSTFLVRCCDVSCNCRVKKVLGSSLLPLYMFCYVICIYSCILADTTISIAKDVCIFLAVTRRLSLVEQDLLFLTEQMILLQFLQWSSNYSIFSYLCSVL